MKKSLLIISFLFSICGIAYGQETGKSISKKLEESNMEMEHIKFMGIPVTGSFDEFRDKVIAKGFKFTGVNENNITILEGLFAGHSADILLSPTRDSQIGSIQIILSDGGRYFKSWEEISSLYFEFKKQLTSKYGKPRYCVEKLRSIDSSDIARMLAVVNGKCKYECDFEIKGMMVSKEFPYVNKEVAIGHIFMTISKDQTIRITYSDIQQYSTIMVDNYNDL